MVRSVFPVVCSDDLDACRDFYSRLLDLDVVFECGWYTALRSSTDPSQQMAFVLTGHESVPTPYSVPVAGTVVTVEVESVDVVHDRAVDLGIEVIFEPRDEDFGQRHVMIRDPNAILVDIIEWIRPSRAFLREVARWRREHR